MKWILIKNKYKIIKWTILRVLFPKYHDRLVNKILFNIKEDISKDSRKAYKKIRKSYFKNKKIDNSWYDNDRIH